MSSGPREVKEASGETQEAKPSCRSRVTPSPKILSPFFFWQCDFQDEKNDVPVLRERQVLTHNPPDAHRLAERHGAAKPGVSSKARTDLSRPLVLPKLRAGKERRTLLVRNSSRIAAIAGGHRAPVDTVLLLLLLLLLLLSAGLPRPLFCGREPIG